MRIINDYLIQELLGIDHYNERLKNINKVKKSELIKVFKKINMDTIFLLEGVENERD